MRSPGEVARIAFTPATPTNIGEVFMARIALVSILVLVCVAVFGIGLLLGWLGGA